MYAVNIADLTEIPPIVARMLLQDFVGVNSPRVEVEKGKLDGFAVVLDGPAAQNEARVKALVELLAGPVSKRVGKPIRVYQRGPRGGWKKVAAAARRGERRVGAGAIAPVAGSR